MIWTKTRLWFVLSGVMSLAGCHGAASQQTQRPHAVSTAAGATGAHTWRMRKVDVTTPVNDLRGGSKSISGMTMLVPTDWSFQGNATLTPKFDCNYTAGRFNVSAESADKTTGLKIFALGASVWSSNRMALAQIQQLNQQWSGTEDCRIEQPKPMAAGLTEVLPKIFADGQVVGSLEPVPGLNEQLASSIAEANQMLEQQAAQHRAPTSHLSAEAGRLRFTATLQGNPIEGWMISLRTKRSDPAPGGSVELSDIPLFAVMYAPRGKLDGAERMMSAMLDSIQVSPEWNAYIAQYIQTIMQIRQKAMNQVSQIYMNMAADNAKAAQDQAAIRRGTQQYANQVYSSVAKNRAAALDHSSQQFALHMGDQAIYSDPTTGQRVQMSNQYGHAWASTTGNTSEFILTDSASFDPNGQVGSGTWKQMNQER